MERKIYIDKLNNVYPGYLKLSVLFILPIVTLVLVRTGNISFIPWGLLILFGMLVISIVMYEYYIRKYRKLVRFFDNGDIDLISEHLFKKLDGKQYNGFAEYKYIKELIEYIKPGAFPSISKEDIKEEIESYIYNTKSYTVALGLKILFTIQLVVLLVSILLHNFSTLIWTNYFYTFLGINILFVIFTVSVFYTQKIQKKRFDTFVMDPDQGIIFYTLKKNNARTSRLYEFESNRKDEMKDYDYIIDLLIALKK